MSAGTITVSPETHAALKLSAERYEKYALRLKQTLGVRQDTAKAMDSNKKKSPARVDLMEFQMYVRAKKDLADMSFRAAACDLCKLHQHTPEQDCATCPVKQKTGKSYCQGTAYCFDVEGVLVDLFPPGKMGATISLEDLRRALRQAALAAHVDHDNDRTTSAIWWAAFADLLKHTQAERNFLRDLLHEVIVAEAGNTTTAPQ